MRGMSLFGSRTLIIFLYLLLYSSKMKLKSSDFVYLTIVCAYCIISPYTKVEESFNIQAIHDIFYYGFTKIQSFDHLDFPGVVPRSFIGSIFISLIVKIMARVAPPDDKFFVQIMARGVLGAFNALSVISLKQTVDWAFSLPYELPSEDRNKTKGAQKKSTPETDPTAKTSINWFWFLMLIQFHLPYYLSRTLPNFLAFPLVNLALTYVFEIQYSYALGILTFTAITLRSEVALFAASLALVLVAARRISVAKVIKSTFIGFVIGGILSAAVDSYFWQKPLMLPELEGFFYNVVEGKSVNWGVSPYSEYFEVEIPKVLNFGGPLVWVFVLLGFVKDRSPFHTMRILGITSFLYVAIYSAQPHKEWRFIAYTIPIFTLLAGNGIATTSNNLRRKVGSLVHVGFVLFILTVGASSIFVTILKGFVSSYNYEGGEALARFHSLIPLGPNPVVGEPLVVHFDVPVAMSGATRFGQLFDDPSITGNKIEYNPWFIYDKTEDEESLEEISDSFDYLIVETPPASINEYFPPAETYRWKMIQTVKRFDRIETGKLQVLARSIAENPFDYLAQVSELAKLALGQKEGDFFQEATELIFQYVSLTDAVWIYKRVSVTDPTESPTTYPWGGMNDEQDASESIEATAPSV